MAMYDAGGCKLAIRGGNPQPEGEMDALLLGRTRVSHASLLTLAQRSFIHDVQNESSDKASSKREILENAFCISTCDFCLINSVMLTLYNNAV